MQEVERLCDTVVIVANGRTVTKGSVAELMAQAQEKTLKMRFEARFSESNTKIAQWGVHNERDFCDFSERNFRCDARSPHPNDGDFSSLLSVPLLLFVFRRLCRRSSHRRLIARVYAINMKDAPSLQNYIERQGYTIKQAPQDYEENHAIKR